MKALSKRNPVPLGKSLDKLFGDWFVVCRNFATTPETFVLKPAQVKALACRNEKAGIASFWLQPLQYEADDFREAWGRIGSGL